jgi:hypothetical protein
MVGSVSRFVAFLRFGTARGTSPPASALSFSCLRNAAAGGNGGTRMPCLRRRIWNEKKKKNKGKQAKKGAGGFLLTFQSF